MKKFYAFIGSLLLATVSFGATFNLFTPATGVLKGNSSTYVTTPAAATDIYGLWSGACSNTTYLRGDGTCATPPGTGGGTVNSVGLSAPSVFSVAGSPVTNTGTLALTFAGGQTANQFLASPDGTTGAVTLRSIVAADIPSLDLVTKTTTTLTGLLKGTGSGAPSAYTGTSCTNQFPRSLNASGAATCASVSLTADVTGIAPAANGGTGNGFTAFTGPATSTKTFTLPNASATVLTDNATVTVAQGGTGVATLTGIAKGNGTSAFSAAASGDVIATWGGSCSASTYLRGDGTCVTPPTGGTGANPSALVGLTAVNGAASTYLRSDGAPALDQSIAPTWTNTHVFSGTPGLTAGLTSIGNGALLTGGNVYTTSTNALTVGTAGAAAVTLATNAAARLAVGSAGNVTINAPSSGITATLNANAATATEGLRLQGSTTAAHYMQATNTSGAAFFGVDSSTGSSFTGSAAYATLIGSNSNTPVCVASNSACRLSITSAGNVTVNAPSSGTSLTTNRSSNGIVASFAGPSQAAHIYTDTSSVYFASDTSANTSLQLNESNDFAALYTAGAERVRANATGNVTVNAPSTGTALAVTSVANAYGINVQTSSTSGQSFGVNIAGGTTTADRAIAIRNQASSTSFFEINGTGAIAVNNGSYGTAGQVLTSAGSGAAPTWVSPSAAIVSGGSLASNGAGGCSLTSNATVGISSCSVSSTVLTVTFSTAAPHYWVCSASNESSSTAYIVNTGRVGTTTATVQSFNLVSTGPITWATVNPSTTAITYMITCQPV